MATPNITDLLKLAEALRAGAPVSVMPEIQPGTIPTGDYPDLLETKWDNSDLGRYTPSMFDPEGRYIREALEMTPDTLRTPTVRNPNAPKPPERMEQRPANPVFTTPYQHEGQYTPTQPASQTETTPTATQPQKNDLESGYENYLKLFEKTLGDKPELDTKRRNQLAMVAGINALGQALKQIVDYTGRTKFGSPINPQQDNLTPALLGQYEKEMQDYLQRKDKYDMMKTAAMQDAFRYAYGDEQYRKQVDDRWKMYDAEKQDRADENAANRKFQTDLYGQKVADEQAMYDQQVKDQAARDKTLHGYDMEKFNAAKSAAEKAGAVTENEMKLAGENVPVIDQKTGRSLIIPKELYWDIYQKIMNNPSSEYDKEKQRLEGADYEQSKNIINGLIAAEFQKYYEPKYDSTGQFQGWMMIDPNAPQPVKEYKTFWDMTPPGTLPNETLPDFWPK